MGKNSDYIEVQHKYLSPDILPGLNDFLLFFFALDWNSVYVLFKRPEQKWQEKIRQ